MSQLLEDRIRTSLRAIAERVPATSVTVAEPAERAASLRLRGPAIAAAAMFAVLFLVGGSVLLLTPDGTRDLDAATAVATEKFPVPSYIPDGIAAVEGGYALRDPSDPSFVRAVVARETADGIADAVIVIVIDSPDTWSYHSDEPDEPIEVNGHAATLIRHDGDGTGIWWEQNDGVVAVSAASADLTLTVAEAVVVIDAETFSADLVSFEQLPDGFSVFAPPILRPTGNDPYVTMLGAWSPTGPVNAVNIATSSLSVEHMFGGAAATGTATTIRGHDAYRFSRTDSEEPVVGFFWAEAEGLTLSISGNYPEDELRKIAESIDLVTETEWRDHYNIDDTAPELPTTTIVPADG